MRIDKEKQSGMENDGPAAKILEMIWRIIPDSSALRSSIMVSGLWFWQIVASVPAFADHMKDMSSTKLTGIDQATLTATASRKMVRIFRTDMGTSSSSAQTVDIAVLYYKRRKLLYIRQKIRAKRVG